MQSATGCAADVLQFAMDAGGQFRRQRLQDIEAVGDEEVGQDAACMQQRWRGDLAAGQQALHVCAHACGKAPAVVAPARVIVLKVGGGFGIEGAEFQQDHARVKAALAKAESGKVATPAPGGIQ